MQYIYNVIYYRNDNLFDISEYENEYFSSFIKAKKFLFEIVKDEERSINDIDFKNWKIKIIKTKVNQIEFKKKVYLYDLVANLLYDSDIKIKYDSNICPIENNIGSIVYIEAFPWSISSPCALPTYGVVGDIYDNKYIVYTFDKWKVVHIHVHPKDIKIINNEQVDDNIIKLSKILNQKERSIKNQKLLDGDMYWFEYTNC